MLKPSEEMALTLKSDMANCTVFMYFVIPVMLMYIAYDKWTLVS